MKNLGNGRSFRGKPLPLLHWAHWRDDRGWWLGRNRPPNLCNCRNSLVCLASAACFHLRGACRMSARYWKGGCICLSDQTAASLAETAPEYKRTVATLRGNYPERRLLITFHTFSERRRLGWISPQVRLEVEVVVEADIFLRHALWSGTKTSGCREVILKSCPRPIKSSQAGLWQADF